MYEELIAFLLGKKSELSEEDLREFMDLLCNALEVSEECSTLEKHSIIENMVDSVDIKDKAERAVVSSAIENILQFDSESGEGSDESILIDKSEEEAPLRNRKVRRGNFGRAIAKSDAGGANNAGPEPKTIPGAHDDEEKSKKIKTGRESGQNTVRPSQIFSLDKPERNISNTTAPHTTEDASSRFGFEIGELEENHSEGPSFVFELDDE